MKILWALSAGWCNFPGCRFLCIVSPSARGQAAVIGDIAHINAHSQEGPRYDPELSPKSIDSYANWILLCPTHHRLVDQQPESYPAETLRVWKRQHEERVRTRLAAEAPPRDAYPPGVLLKEREIYRIARREAPWTEVLPSHGRWSDPFGKYSVTYWATTMQAALSEVLGPFRLIHGDSVQIPDDWFSQRVVLKASVTAYLADLRRADAQDGLERLLETRLGVRPRLRTASGSEDFSTGSWRAGQEISRLLFEAQRYDGIAYRSNIIGTEMLALFGHAAIVGGSEIPFPKGDLGGYIAGY